MEPLEGVTLSVFFKPGYGRLPPLPSEFYLLSLFRAPVSLIDVLIMSYVSLSIIFSAPESDSSISAPNIPVLNP
jgi:hypothetical protein